jgi:[ribosomal protein S5]-alanine N-acetyltransferase
MPASLALALVTTERLRGRRPEEGDLADYVRIWGDPRIDEAAWPADMRTPEDAARMLRGSIEHWDRWGFGPWTVVERSSDAVVGHVGLAHTTVLGHPDVEVAWFIDPGAWGRGYATEMAQEALRAAFITLDLDSIVSYTTTANEASQAVMRKLGMTYEADIEHAGLPHVLYRLARVT